MEWSNGKEMDWTGWRKKNVMRDNACVCVRGRDKKVAKGEREREDRKRERDI